MIGKVTHGNDIYGLLRYLLLEGQAGQPGLSSDHSDCHVVAAWRDEILEPEWLPAVPGKARGKRVGQLAEQMEQPLTLAGIRGEDGSVYHVSLSCAPGDRRLSDEEWTEVARDALDRTGISPRGDENGCRWVLVRHADDHVRLAVTPARQDGRRAKVFRDFAKLGQACKAAEARYGL